MNRLTVILTASILAFGMLMVTPALQAATPSGMVQIPGGEFEMGDHYGVGGSDELPLHVLRGGSWFNDGINLRCAVRASGDPDYRNGGIGFRLALHFQSLMI